LSITPTSAINRLFIEAQALLAEGSGVRRVSSLIQDSTANALEATITGPLTANVAAFARITHEMAAGTTSSTTFNYRAGPPTAATMTFNGEAAARLYGGVANSYMRIMEIFV